MLRFFERRFLVAIAAALALGLGGPSRSAPVPLEVGPARVADVVPGAVTSFEIPGAPGELLRVVVRAPGLPVVARILSPEGVLLVERRGTAIEERLLSLSILPRSSGCYRLELRQGEEVRFRGRCEVRLEERRPVRDGDSVRLDAEGSLAEAESLRALEASGSSSEALSHYEHALALFRSLGDAPAEAATLCEIGELEEELGRPGDSVVALRRALSIRESRGDCLGAAWALLLLGESRVDLGDARGAMADYERARALFREAGDPRGQAAAESNVGSGHRHMSEMREALARYEIARTLWAPLSDPLGEAALETNLGLVHSALGDTARALSHLENGLFLRTEAHDRFGQGTCHHYIGSLLQRRGDYEGARGELEEAIRLYRELGARSREAPTLVDLGTNFYLTDDMPAAVSRYQEALALYRGIANREGEAIALSCLGAADAHLGEPRKALEHQTGALAVFRELGNRTNAAMTLLHLSSLDETLGRLDRAAAEVRESLGLFREAAQRALESNALDRLARIHQARGDWRAARAFSEEGLELARKVGDRRAEARALGGIAVCDLELGHRTEAERAFTAAAEISRAIGDVQWEAWTNAGLGRSALAGGNPRAAVTFLLRALERARRSGHRATQSGVLLHLARAESATGLLEDALEHGEEAVALYEATRRALSGDELRASFFATAHDVHELVIGLLLRLHRRSPGKGYDVRAFEASERARARSLLDLLLESHADVREGVPSGLLDRQRKLEARLQARAAERVRLSADARDATKRAALDGEIDALIAKRQDLEAEVRARSPRYAALTRPEPLRLAEVQRSVLDDDTALLEIALGRQRSALWVVTRTSSRSLRLPPRVRLEALARRVFESWSGGRGDARADAAELARLLLPAAALAHRRILVVADGALQYVPFAALPIPEGPAAGRPVVTEHEVVSLPSASTGAVLRREAMQRPAPAHAVAVLADPVFASDDPRVRPGARARAKAPPEDSELTRSATESGLAGFPRLPATRSEAEEIVALADAGEGFAALDFSASRETLTRPDLARYRVLHLATHGLLNARHPELGGIVLSLVDENGRPKDGFLQAHEIYNLRLGADLVVLSACQTALGREVRGEGVVGLTRAFMYAGAKAVLASLWRVSDRATAELMKEFYAGLLRRRLPAAAALREAQENVRKRPRWAAPYYWAGFVLQGDWR